MSAVQRREKLLPARLRLCQVGEAVEDVRRPASSEAVATEIGGLPELVRPSKMSAGSVVRLVAKEIYQRISRLVRPSKMSSSSVVRRFSERSRYSRAARPSKTSAGSVVRSL